MSAGFGTPLLSSEQIEDAFNSARDEVRPGAAERVAAYGAEAAALPQPSAPTWQSKASEPPGHRGPVEFPASGDYPVTLAEVVGRLVALEKRLAELERGRGGPARGMRPPSGDEVWRQAVGEHT